MAPEGRVFCYLRIQQAYARRDSRCSGQRTSSTGSLRHSLIRSSASADRAFAVCVDTLSHAAVWGNKGKMSQRAGHRPNGSLGVARLVPCRYRRLDVLHFRPNFLMTASCTGSREARPGTQASTMGPILSRDAPRGPQRQSIMIRFFIGTQIIAPSRSHGRRRRPLSAGRRRCRPRHSVGECNS